MSDDAEVTMMLPPIGLLPEEEDILKRHQSHVK